MKFDAIVAGSGLWGCTIARRLAESGHGVLVLEKRKSVGGNCQCRTPYTRIHEFRHYHPEKAGALAKQQGTIGGKLIVGGRLGEYRYYDMDKSIAAALSI